MSVCFELPLPSADELRAFDICVELYPDYYRFVGASRPVIFTKSGEAYYRGWFERYGFSIDGIDYTDFIDAVITINRSIRGSSRASNGFFESELDALQPLLASGEPGDFVQAVTELVERRRSCAGIGGDRVVVSLEEAKARLRA